MRGQRELDSVRVIVLVDSQDEEIIARAYHAGAHSCLLKSEDFAGFHDILMLVGRDWLEPGNAPESLRVDRLKSRATEGRDLPRRCKR